MLKKAVMYVRVSSKEQADQGGSPEAQRTLLYDFSRRNGFDVVKEFEDIETAKSAGRKEFQAMLEYVKAHDVKYIIVEKTDRLHRNFKDYVAIEELTEQHGVTVHLVKDGVAIGKESKSADKLMYGIRTVMAKSFIDNLREEVQKGYQVKLAHGEYPHQAKMGYINAKDPHNPKHNVILPDPLNRQLALKMFEYYAADMYSVESLIERLEADGLTSNIRTKNRKLNKSSVASCLSDPFYIGKFLWKGKMIQGSHEPIVPVEIWHKVQDVLSRRNKNKHKEHNVQPFVYGGLFVCGACGRSITAEKKKGRYVYYHCTQYRTNCGQPYVKEETIEQGMQNVVGLLRISQTGVQYVTAALKASLSEKRKWQDTAFDGLVVEQTRIKKRMDALYDDRLDRRVTESFYDEKSGQLTKQLGEIEERMSKHNRADVSYYDFGRRIIELAENAEVLLKHATPEEKREFTQYLLSNSKLMDGKPIFSLKQPFSAIEKRSPCDDRLAWQGL